MHRSCSVFVQCTLSGTQLGIKEQFLPKYENHRKQLYTEAKLASQNTDKNVRLVRDKLSINGQEFIPNEEANNPTDNDNSARVQNSGMNRNSDPDRTELKRTFTNQRMQRNDIGRFELDAVRHKQFQKQIKPDNS